MMTLLLLLTLFFMGLFMYVRFMGDCGGGEVTNTSPRLTRSTFEANAQ